MFVIAPSISLLPSSYRQFSKQSRDIGYYYSSKEWDKTLRRQQLVAGIGGPGALMRPDSAA